MRVNLFSGPGAGKSTLALWLTCELRKAGIETELVDEWIKRWAYEKKHIRGWDQYYVFASQLEKEEFYLKNSVSCIVTDSPLLMQMAYMKKQGNDRFIPLCLAAAKMFEEDYPSINIFLERGKLPYKEIGRWQTYDEALEMDKLVKSILEQNVQDFYEFETTDWDGILQEVFARLKFCSC
jgi:hypothetical protein